MAVKVARKQAGGTLFSAGRANTPAARAPASSNRVVPAQGHSSGAIETTRAVYRCSKCGNRYPLTYMRWREKGELIVQHCKLCRKAPKEDSDA